MTNSHVVVTLDPKKFVEKKQRAFHIGNLMSFKPCIALHNQSEVVITPRLHYETGKLTTFPPDTKAFLYYFTPPEEKRRIAGELRLRVVPSGDPASFESGSDLLRLNGQSWARPLLSLPGNYTFLYEKLREERLVRDDLGVIISTLLSGSSPRYRGGQKLYALNDTFIVDFSSHQLRLSVITEQGIESLPLFKPFVEYRGQMERTAPYTGTYTNYLLSTLLD